MIPITICSPNKVVEVGEGTTTLVGVINLSRDSNITHTIVSSPGGAVDLAARYLAAGAELVDVGAQSSRYDSRIISSTEEMELLIPTVSLLVDEGFLVCAETTRPEVARAALDAGAVLLNTIAGLDDEAMLSLLQNSGTPCVVSYLESNTPHDVGVFLDEPNKHVRILCHLQATIAKLSERGILNAIVDPGIGFAYRGDYWRYTQQQIAILRNLSYFGQADRPIFVSVPRKDDLNSVLALATMALENGANLLRVHDTEVCRIARFLGHIR